MQSLRRWHRNHNYSLTCSDILSKYARLIAFKAKTGSSLVEAFKKIFKQGIKPKKLQTDTASELKKKKNSNIPQKLERASFRDIQRNKSSSGLAL